LVLKAFISGEHAQNLMKAKHDEDADGKAKPVDHEFKLDEPLPKWQGRYSLRR
jgi:hypothetical protein